MQQLQTLLRHPDVTNALATIAFDMLVMGDPATVALKDAGVILAVGQVVEYLEPLIGGLVGPFLAQLPGGAGHLVMNNFSVVLSVLGYMVIANYTGILDEKYGRGAIPMKDNAQMALEQLAVAFAANLLRGASLMGAAGAHHDKVAGQLGNLKKASYGDDGK